MITYTKRNLSFIAIILTITLFVLFNIIHLYFKKPKEKSSFNQVYSRTIPNYLNNNIENEFLFKTEQNKTVSNINLEKNAKPIATSKKLVENTLNISKQTSNNTNNSNEISTKKDDETKENLEDSILDSNNNEQTNLNEKTQTQVLQENKNIAWRIQIPKIDLDVHISEGISSSVLLTSVGHFEQTSKWQGNVCLAAHNRGYKCNFFQNIKDLQIGDEIIYKTANNKKVYKVQTNKVISETDWSYLQSTKDNRITLITCEENRKDCRRCVQAVEIANYKIKK